MQSLAIKGVDVNDSSDGQQYQKGELGLELNHTHFLMLDDGTIRHFDTKDYRTRLCAHLGRIDAEIADPSRSISANERINVSMHRFSSPCGDFSIGRW